MKTDLDRLHGVVLGKRTGRGSGKTFAACHCIAGATNFEKEILVLLPYQHWQYSHIAPMLRKILGEHDIEVMPESTEVQWILSNGATLYFRSGKEALLGWHSAVVDMNDMLDGGVV